MLISMISTHGSYYRYTYSYNVYIDINLKSILLDINLKSILSQNKK